MKKICLEMPTITKCMASECAYNANSNCHARAITIGACKTASCKFNEDLECMAESIQVGMIRSEANCMTFASR